MTTTRESERRAEWLPTPALRGPLVGPDEWVELQAQLRSALSEWVEMSTRADVDPHLDDAEVILGADGATAKTRVPMTARGRTTVREQRWERGPSGWTIVDDRDAERVRR